MDDDELLRRVHQRYEPVLESGTYQNTRSYDRVPESLQDVHD
jgi:hypothetical protein